ncbi:heterokaryon incompatibility protein-domain-containing protein [Cubamyces menziesii]|nr:heterokaryon incompatibility protein-domain-containing protein [Cubamyces menziesii]
MPRFLDTRTGHFVWIDRLESMPYAILSHTWTTPIEGGEQTYDDIRRIQGTVSLSQPGAPVFSTPTYSLPSILSHSRLSEKIRGFCAYAREAGYDYAWADMCCIDKSSSAELSEAINSMYELYRSSSVCYVYLADVADDTNPSSVNSEFRRSRWHTRGWTLQELVAPRRLVFLTRSWRVLGTKLGLARTLSQITGISSTILTGCEDISSASVAQRMSWAADRQTTRVEDRAYSLMGIFGIVMSPVYGEGRNAFLRLQEEIIKNIADQSIFAWGPYANITAESRYVDTVTVGPTSDAFEVDLHGHGLLAPSPFAFKYSGDIVPISSDDFASILGTKRDCLPSLHCVFTPQGVKIELPCVDTAQTGSLRSRLNDIARRSKSYGRLALLRCRIQNGPFVALPLPSLKDRLATKDDYLKISLHTPICSEDTNGLYNIFARSLRLSESFVKMVGTRGWKFVRTDLLILASQRDPRYARVDYGAQAGTVTMAIPVPKLLSLAPWCPSELDASGFDVMVVQSQPELSLGGGAGGDHSQPTDSAPVWAAILSRQPGSYNLDERHPEFDLTIEVTPVPSQLSTFAARVRHVMSGEGALDVSLDERLTPSPTAPQDSPTVCVEGDFMITGPDILWKRSPFHGRLLRITVQSSPRGSDDTASNVTATGETLPSLSDVCCAEHYLVSLDLSEPMFVDSGVDSQTQNMQSGRRRRLRDWFEVQSHRVSASSWFRSVVVFVDAMCL